MRISGLQKTTLQDFPGCIAAIVFTQGCNYRCPFCQNSELIGGFKALLSEKEVLNYIKKRAEILDGIVVSGGEPTVQVDLIDFIKKIKRLGLKVKLDTNGTNPIVLEKLLDEGIVDYVAMDIKHAFSKYTKISGVIDSKIENIIKSMELLKNSNIDYEFRTTIVKEFHKLDDIEEIISYVGEAKYYIQNFENSDYVLDKSLHGFSDEELKSIKNKFSKYPNVNVRGI